MSVFNLSLSSPEERIISRNEIERERKWLLPIGRFVSGIFHFGRPERERERERESDMNGMKNGKKWRKNTYKSDGSYCNGKSYVENKVG